MAEQDLAGEPVTPKARTQVIDGIHMPLGWMDFEWTEKIDQLRNMKLRDDDVFLFSYSKTGTHWLWEMVNMLRMGRAEPDAHTKVQFMMEFVGIDKLDGLPSPRTLNTHLPLFMIPIERIVEKRLKMIHVYRNPKDTCVSLYHMTRSSKPMAEILPANTFEEFYEYYYFSEKVVFGSYIYYLKMMRDFMQQNPDTPFFNLSYEDIKKDPVSCVKKLAAFLELSVSDELCSAIAEACSFDNMKKQEAEKATPRLTSDSQALSETEIMIKENKPVIFRKGQVGDWKNYFTVAMNERLDEFIRQELTDMPFTFTYE